MVGLIADFSLKEFCNNTGSILQFVGWVLTIIKVAMPILIITFGILDLGKAVVASKEEEIKTGAKRLLWRVVAGVVIFFIPSIVLWVFGSVADFNSATQGGSFDNCKNCILTPWSDCSTS